MACAPRRGGRAAQGNLVLVGLGIQIGPSLQDPIYGGVNPHMARGLGALFGWFWGFLVLLGLHIVAGHIRV